MQDAAVSAYRASGREPSIQPVLPIGRYRLRFKAPTQREPSQYLGSAWRGAFGHALKKAVCVTGLRDCRACMLYRSCTYPYVFETPPPSDAEKMRRYPAAPHPFVLVVPMVGLERAKDGNCLLGLNLIGRAIGSLGHIVFALQRAGEGGVGDGRHRYCLIGTEQWRPDGWTSIDEGSGALAPLSITTMATPPIPRRVQIHFVTPLRVKRRGELVGAEDLRFADLFGSLLRRISMLSYFHTDSPLETEFKELVEASRRVEFQRAELQWHDWNRYSSRQDTRMKLGGVRGKMVLEGEALEPFWPYLWLGQWTHAGHAASMGLGRMRVSEAVSLPSGQ